MNTTLADTFGNIDIYLFDQLLKGRFDNCKTVLDAGCGAGRNIRYFLKKGYLVYGVDNNAEAIKEVQNLVRELSAGIPGVNFQVAPVEDLPFADQFFELVICSAVLHFATGHHHFDTMLRSMWRVLKTGGFFFCRLASSIGIEHLIKNLGEGRFILPDGTERYLVDEQVLTDFTHTLNASLFEPIKTTNVQNLRCMTTWCLQKN